MQRRSPEANASQSAAASPSAASAARKARPGASEDEDPEIGISANNLGDSLLRLGRWQEAKPHIERACASFELTFGAVADDASAPIWNPGGLGRLTRKEIQATQTTLFGLGFKDEFPITRLARVADNPDVTGAAMHDVVVTL